MQAIHERVAKRLGSVGLSGAMALVAAWASGPAAAPVTALASTGVTPTVVHAVPADFQPGSGSAHGTVDTTFDHYIQPKPETARLTGSGGSASKSAEGGGAGPKAGVWRSSNWPGVNFADVSVSGFRGPTPPDPNGVVGPNNYMEAVNGKFAVYDRSGVQRAAASDDYFTGRNRQTPQRFMSDPTLNYDPRTNRWFYQEASFNRAPDCPSGRAACNFEIDFGWSMTSDPSNLEAWCRWVFPFSATILPDYTKTAVDDNWIYFGSNLFDFSTPPATPFLSANVVIFPKPTTSDPITNCGSAPTGFSFGSGASPILHPGGEQVFTIKPVDTFSSAQGAGATAYLVSARFACFAGGRNQIGIMHIGGTTAAPTFVYDGLQMVNGYSCPPNVPEPNGRQIDTLDGRIAQGAAIPDPSNGGKEGLWLAHTVALGAGADNIAIQWYEILMPVAAGSSPNTPSLAQQGSIGGGTPAGIGKFTFAWNSGIAPAKAGNEGVLAYNWAEAVDMTGNNTTRSQLRAASHDPSMPSGAMSLPLTLANSLDDPVDFSCPSSGSTCRWGDYAGASTDPNDNHVVWGTGMWTGLRRPDPAIPPTGTFMAQWATQNFAITAAASGATTSGPYVGVSPNRILDTRTTAKIPANSTLDVQVTGTAGVPATGVGAVAVNATGLNATQPTYVTVYPAGVNPRPLASTVNFGPGQQVAALTEVPVGTGGKITVYNSQGSVDLLLDVQGYTMSSLQTNTAGLYKPLAAPARILDTRTGTPFGAIAANTTQTLAVPLPDSRASAVILNATAINGAAAGYLTLYPTGAATPPTASNVNFPAGKNVPNRVMVQLGTGPNAGKINIYNGSTAAIDVALDMSGWFTDGTDPAATGATFHPLSPARILDTRAASAIGPYSSPIGPGSWRWVQVAGMGMVPASGASSMVGTLTAVNATAGTYLTAHPTDQALPNASDLNPGPGDTIANMIVVRLGSGDQAIYVYNNVGFIDVLIDATGYYG